MKRIFKTLLLLGGTAAAGYYGFKVYKTIQAVNKVEKNLPDYLEEICGNKPEVHASVQINTSTLITLKLLFEKDALTACDDIVEKVMDYIRDFYPELLKYKVNIKLEEHTADDTKLSGAEYNDPEEG